MLPILLPIFSIIFLYFILQVKTRLDTSQGVPPHTKRPVTSEMATPQGRRLPYPEMEDTKNIVHRSYSSQYGAFLPSLFVLFFDKDITYIFPTDPPWRRMPAYGAATAATLAPTSTWVHHQDNKHPVFPELWDGAGHPGGGTRWY